MGLGKGLSLGAGLDFGVGSGVRLKGRVGVSYIYIMSRQCCIKNPEICAYICPAVSFT